MRIFPANFLWGSATSSHQVEGLNIHNDWWRWEQLGHGKEPSGQACRHYQLFQEDFDLVGELGHNSHRLSFEWSRIEPEEGKFSIEEICHYKEVIAALKKRGIEPVVTLHHFTNPIWFADKGGWLGPKAVEYFLRYAKKVVSEFCADVRFWITINEPLIYVYYSYFDGAWPPGQKSLFKTLAVRNALVAAHIATYRYIHKLYCQRQLSSAKVSFAHNIMPFIPCTKDLKTRSGAALRNWMFNREILQECIRQKALDFIGVNYYSRNLVEVQRWTPQELLAGFCRHNHNTLPKNAMGWEIYPQGIYDILMWLKSYNLPIFILENGICVDDDNIRWEFIRQHLYKIHDALQNGVQVMGYTYWSLLDNFEWDKGFVPRFGLIEVDYNTYVRRVRESARKLSKVCLTGILD